MDNINNTTTINTTNDSKWVRCLKCGHKLFYLDEYTGKMKISIKCHSCKLVNEIKF